MHLASDFKIECDIVIEENKCARYMHDPPLNGLSIDHVDDYYDGINGKNWISLLILIWNLKNGISLFISYNLYFL